MSSQHPDSLSDVQIAKQSLGSYAREAFFPTFAIVIIRLLLFWTHQPALTIWIVVSVYFLVLPFLIRDRKDWTLGQTMVLGGLSGLVLGLWTALLEVFRVAVFTTIFQFIIQPVLLVTLGALAGGFIFVFVFPIIKKLKNH